MYNASLRKPQAFLRPRPVRVAYLVEEGDYAHEILDAIFADCHGRWGGRYSLVIPCEAGAPHPAYLPWLRAYDPDIIYSYVDLDEAKVKWLHEALGPSYLVKHEIYDHGPRDLRRFRPELPLECLTALSVAPQYARAFPASAPQPMLVVDSVPGQPRDRFVGDNFGSYAESFDWWPLPENLTDVIRPLTIAAEELLRDPRRGYRLDGETVPNTVALLRRMATERNSIGIAQLAADSTPRIEIRDRFTEAFSLIVGDTFSDRVIFWNDRSVVPPYLGKNLATLIVSPARLEDTDFFAALTEFLKRRNGVQRSSGSPWVNIRSTSLSADQLAAFRDRFQAADSWNGYHVAAITSVDDIVPSEEGLRRSRGLVTGHILDRSAQWKEFPAVGAAIRPPTAMPAHLQSVQGPSMAAVGAWALDVDIERQNNLTRFSNVQHSWCLPRRLRMHGAFLKPYEGPKVGSRLRCPRASREGHLVLFTECGEDPPAIALPDDEMAFRYALEQGYDWPPFSRRDSGGPPTGPYAWSRPSDKGRYLMGALRLMGGLQNAGAILLHDYWRTVFQELGGAIANARIDGIKATLKKRLRKGTIETEDDWERVARLVATEAHRVRIPLQSLSFEELRKRHAPLLEQERQFLEENQTENPEEWMEHAQVSLPRSVQWLCTQTVLYQGHEWRCRTCYHTNWNDMSALQPKLSCEVCGTSEAAPVDKPWDFRLNGFLREALKEHGLLALVWCLIQLEERARNTFYFLGPHDLFLTLPENEVSSADREADLICVIDGRVHLCEVKSSARQINIARLADVAKQLRPDVVTLAIMDVASAKLKAKSHALKQALIGTDIHTELLTLEERTFDKNAYLPSNRLQRVKLL
jgi:hypothetical protein